MASTRPAPQVEIESGERRSPRAEQLVGCDIDGRYTGLGLLGSGGMADVLEVEHRELGRRFALKLMREESSRDASLRARFEREARTVARLESEHIVAILDCGRTARGEPYFVMERLYGEDLRQLLEREGALSVPRAVQIAIHVARALGVAHAAGVVHRDLKPENLYLVPGSAGAETCKVLDFGVAKLEGESLTLPGTLLGTARYMSPEQIRDGNSVGPPTDVFSLGAILYECLAGEPAFSADTLERVLFKIVSEPSRSLAAQRPELPEALVGLVERMMDKDPAARPQNAGELVRELERYVPAPASGGPTLSTSAFELRAAPPRRSSAAVFAVGLAFGVALGLGLPRALRPGPAPASASASAARVAPVPVVHAPPAAASEQAAAPSATLLAPAPVRRSSPSRSAQSPPSAAPAPAPKPPLFFPADE
jgi:eukaryotic-like serine/threonine-protein kinase